MYRSVAGKTAAFLVAVALLSPVASQPVLSASPRPTEVRGQALFAEGGGTTTADSSGYGLPGTLIALSNSSGHYTFLVDNGNDLRVDGGIFSNHADWYTGMAAVIRCGGSNPCSPATCSDWDPLPTQYGIQMCGYSIYVDHSAGSNPTILSARTIAAAGGWQARSGSDIIHADQLVPCPAHPKNLGYPTPFLQETNVCIGVPQIVDPLNDPANPSAILPPPDFEALSTCPGGPYPCGPVASPTCVAEPGTTLRLPTGTLTSPARLTISGTTAKYTICPGIYYGGFSVLGDSRNPSVVMLPGTYVMIGGGFSVGGTASITSVSSQGDGVTIYNSGGSEAFSESFPSDTSLIPTTCPPPVGSLCEATGTPILNPPSAASIAAGHPVTYKLTVPKGTFAGAPVPTGTAASFTFYNGSTPIVCEAPGLRVTTVGTSLVATCTTRYTKFGSKGITAVYAGDAVYAATGAMKSQEVVPAPTASQDNIDLRTATAPCSWNPVTDPCGRIVLHAPTSGRYSGLLIFQDRAPGFLEGSLAVLLQPALGAGACDMTTVSTPLGDQPKFMADGVPSYGPPFNTLPVPDPCGPLGGLSGTIYAPHQSTSVADWDAVVHIMASGAANLQVIAAAIDFTHGNPSHQARFTFAPSDSGDQPRSTSTVVTCSPDPVVYGGNTTCTATVTDAASGGTPSDPSGEVAFTVTTGPGDIAPTSCSLASDGSAETFTGACAVTYTPSAVGTGTHTIGASYGGSGVHSGSTGSGSVEVVKLDQAITFDPIGPKAYLDADFGIAPSASSGLPVALAAVGDCTIDSAVAPATVHIVRAGSCTITASQGGDATYDPAPDVPNTFTIGEGQIGALSPVHAWVSLKNGDDVGTSFDVKVDLLKNGTTIESGLVRCVSGVGRAATPGTEVVVPWTFVPATVDKGDVLSLKVSTRVGTVTETTKCAGKNSAVGLRLYYDSVSQASSVGATIGSVPLAFTEYLRSNGNVCNNAASTGVTNRYLDSDAPTATGAKCKDSAAVNFAGGNPFKEIGTWGILGNWTMP